MTPEQFTKQYLSSINQAPVAPDDPKAQTLARAALLRYNAHALKLRFPQLHGEELRKAKMVRALLRRQARAMERAEGGQP